MLTTLAMAPNDAWWCSGSAFSEADDPVDVVDGRCDEPTEDCSSGIPAVCNAGCAAIFLPYYAECSGLLQDPHTSSILQTTAAKCRLAESEGNGGNLDAGSSLARQLDLVCDGVALKDCIPDCDARLHGDLVCFRGTKWL